MVVNAVNVSYQGKIVAVKLSKNREVFFFSASMYPIGSSDLIGDDITMTLHQFLVDYITDDLYISEIDMYNIILCTRVPYVCARQIDV